MVDTRITTLGKNGSRVERKGEKPVLVDIAQEDRSHRSDWSRRCLSFGIPHRHGMGSQR